MRTQQIALFTKPDDSTGYYALGMETPEICMERLKRNGMREIMIIKVKIECWCA
jgi:hypothetical protein